MAKKEKSDGLITVRVVSNQPVGEPGGPYLKGATFRTTQERADALGDHQVKVIDESPESAPAESAAS